MFWYSFESSLYYRQCSGKRQPGSSGVYGGVALHRSKANWGGGRESQWAGKHHVCMMLCGLPRLVRGLHLLQSSSTFPSFKSLGAWWAEKHHVLHDAFRSTATCTGLIEKIAGVNISY